MPAGNVIHDSSEATSKILRLRTKIKYLFPITVAKPWWLVVAREMFILSIAAITVTGVLGALLYKYGTNILGTITFESLKEIKFTTRSIFYLGILALGLAMAAYAGYALSDDLFIMRYLFTPAIFFGLVMLFISRFLIGIPLSVTGVGKLTAILTALTVVCTAIASNLFFKESFSLRMVAGIALGVIAVLLIGEV